MSLALVLPVLALCHLYGVRVEVRTLVESVWGPYAGAGGAEDKPSPGDK